jgi:hypothetical protein
MITNISYIGLPGLGGAPGDRVSLENQIFLDLSFSHVLFVGL